MAGKITNILELPKPARDLIDRYCALEVQGVKVVCPYHVNTGLFSRNRALGGKGRPEEIEAAAEKYLARYQMHGHGDPERLRTYMMACGLGVDCSGFASWVMNEVTKDAVGKPIWKCLKFPGARGRLIKRVRPVENISARLLTGYLNADKVDDLRQVRPGDLIRLINGGHVMVVAEVGLNATGGAEYFDYAESSVSYGGESGIDKNRVTIVKPKGTLGDQKWGDKRVYEALETSGDDARVVRLKTLKVKPKL